MLMEGAVLLVEKDSGGGLNGFSEARAKIRHAKLPFLVPKARNWPIQIGNFRNWKGDRATQPYYLSPKGKLR